jgi:hypothetical protein
MESSLRSAKSTLMSQFTTTLRRVLCGSLLAISSSVYATTIDVLWYTYADPSSEYVSFYSSLAGSGPGSAGSYPESSGLTWNLTFFGPSSAPPTFRMYDVLVIESGEAFRTGAPGGPLATPNYSGILDNKNAIEAARGIRSFISGADADFHAVRGDSGLCPGAGCGNFDGARGYVINAVNWAASGGGLGIVSFYHGEFPESFWWDDARSFLRAELQGNWFAFRENDVVIPPSAASFPLNEGLTSAGLSDWTFSFHGGFSFIPNYSTTVDSESHPGLSVSIATVALCQPTSISVCISGAVYEPPSIALFACGIFLLFLVLNGHLRCPARTLLRTRPNPVTLVGHWRALPEIERQRP